MSPTGRRPRPAGCRGGRRAAARGHPPRGEERARRRLHELQQRGIAADYETVLRQQNQRDHEDFSRPVGGLRKAEDAIEVCTTGLPLAAVAAQLLKLVRERLAIREQ